MNRDAPAPAHHPPPAASELLAHAQFVDGIARRLLRDVHAAEDVTQDTWLAALSRPAGAEQAGRAWLGSVARNFALQTLRRNARRRRREQIAARQELVEAEHRPDPLAAHAVAEAVAALADPYRAVVWLRYHEDLGPLAIARRLALPLETVRTRLRRAREILRLRLAPGLAPSLAPRVAREPAWLIAAPHWRFVTPLLAVCLAIALLALGRHLDVAVAACAARDADVSAIAQ